MVRQFTLNGIVKKPLLIDSFIHVARVERTNEGGKTLRHWQKWEELSFHGVRSQGRKQHSQSPVGPQTVVEE